MFSYVYHAAAAVALFLAVRWIGGYRMVNFRYMYIFGSAKIRLTIAGLRRETTADFFERAARRFPERVAVQLCTDEVRGKGGESKSGSAPGLMAIRTLTYRELELLSGKFATWVSSVLPLEDVSDDEDDENNILDLSSGKVDPGQDYGDKNKNKNKNKRKSSSFLAALFRRGRARQARKRRGTVALMMEGGPAFIAAWLGAVRCGASVALINTNQRGKALDHSLRISGARVVVTGGRDLAEAVAETEAGASMHRWVAPDSDNVNSNKANAKANAATIPTSLGEDLDAAIATADPGSWGRADRTWCRTGDVVHYIYTSGTTGLPKAAKVTHFRFMAAGTIFGTAFGVRPADRVYCSLPLYHSTGGVIGVSVCWFTGAALVVRPRFSASRFWRDCSTHGCTVVMYIGEICRYLCATPPTEHDTAHGVRLALGNGLRRDVWTKFQSRFGVPVVGEFYGATEGNAILVNTENVVGAVGITTPLLRVVYPVVLVRHDAGTGEIVRDPRTGLCIRCDQRGVVGELLGKIVQSDPSRRFDGYRADRKGTMGKVVRDVVKRGDQWFRSGDLLRQDSDGFLYFVDRVGDTFRWKGENVATGEVGGVVMSVDGVEEANVYGVAVPGTEGRAGMAAVVLEKSASSATGEVLKRIYEATEADLPSYARPLFVRIASVIETTGTFKHRKVELVAQGFDPSTVADPVFFRDTARGTYVGLTGEMYNDITSGRIRV